MTATKMVNADIGFPVYLLILELEVFKLRQFDVSGNDQEENLHCDVIFFVILVGPIERMIFCPFSLPICTHTYLSLI